MVFSSVPLYHDPPNWNQNHSQQQQQQQLQQQQQQQLSQHGQMFASGGGGGGMEMHHHHQQQQHQQYQQQQLQQHQLRPPVPPSGALMAPRPDGMGSPVALSGAGGGGGGAGGGLTGGAVVRPGSMTDKARMAKIPQPEPGLKCPRCESTNTKFCYFNNYSLTQPRHFCKTCRRYWTRGGTLRNVPVGGGCRRNKRTKSSKSSSSAASASGGGTSSSTTSSTTTAGGGNGNGSTAAGAAGAMMSSQGQGHAQMPFFGSLHPLGAGSGDHYGTGASRLGFPGLINSLDPVDYQLGGGGAAAAAMALSEQWRLPQMQQFPFFGRADGMHQQQQQMAGLYPFDATDASGFAGEMMGGVGGSKQLVPGSAGLITQLASVKMEDNPPSNNSMAGAASAREFLGLPGNIQFWGGGNNGAGGNENGGSHSSGTVAPGGAGGGGGWVDQLPGFNSSSSGNIL
ncbi:unnamed protein product [Triticum turgidum subsp. durum]|uniref:Dof zinc finger protein n=1 Tax=Triticum turgidum subsp. durum TaxID=4567 RepID=A0A9R0XMG8_TRITD|nr:unnamed protein product [Triticum turgidum subsp. durum]